MAPAGAATMSVAAMAAASARRITRARLAIPARSKDPFHGGVPEWLNGAVSKTVVPFSGHRGFESLPLRSQADVRRRRALAASAPTRGVNARIVETVVKVHGISRASPALDASDGSRLPDSRAAPIVRVSTREGPGSPASWARTVGYRERGKGSCQK